MTHRFCWCSVRCLYCLSMGWSLFYTRFGLKKIITTTILIVIITVIIRIIIIKRAVIMNLITIVFNNTEFIESYFAVIINGKT